MDYAFMTTDEKYKKFMLEFFGIEVNGKETLGEIQELKKAKYIENLKAKQEEGSNFRIVELNGIFKIERKFKEVNSTGCLWWSKKVEKYIWKDITTYGSACYVLPLYGTKFVIDTYKDKMREFRNLSEAEQVLDKLINPPKPVYHYR